MTSAPPAVRWTRPSTLLWLAAFVGAVALLGVGVTRVDFETGVDEFVPRDDASAAATVRMAEQFGGDPIVVLLESDKPGELLAEDNLVLLGQLEGQLDRLPDVREVFGPYTALNAMAGRAQDALAEFSGYRDALRAEAEAQAKKRGETPAQVKESVRRATAEFDERYGNLFTKAMGAGLPTLRNEGWVQGQVFNSAGNPRPLWDFLVPQNDALAILIRPDAALSQSKTEKLVTAVEKAVNGSKIKSESKSVTVTGIPSIVAALGEQLKHEMPLLGGIAIGAVGAWFLFTSWTRRRWRLLPLGASLLGTVTVLGLAGWFGRELSVTAVAFLPVLLGIGSDFMTYLHRGAGVRTVAAAGAASVAGFAALMIAPVPAVADLGVSLAVGLAVTVLVSIGVHRWGPHEAELPPRPTRPIKAGRPARWTIAAAVAVLAAIGWSLFSSLTIQSDFASLADGLKKYSDAEKVEDVVGSSGEVSLVVRGDNVLTPETYAWMLQTRRTIAADHGDELRSVLSPADLLEALGENPAPSEVDAAVKLLPPYLLGAVATPDRSTALLTYGVDLNDLERLSDLRTYLDGIAKTAPDSVHVEVAGLPMVAVSAHDAIQDDRLLAAGLGILAAAVALLLVLWDVRIALTAAAAAAMASGVVALGMKIFDISLTPMTAGLGSLTAAVACEFTVLLALAQRRGDGRLSRAVDLAAAASGTGYLVLVISDLGLIRGFGGLLALTVLASLLVARLLVWAFLPAAVPPEAEADDDRVDVPEPEVLEEVR